MNNFFTVLKKELTDILRDKKTLAFTIILPILIYPLMFKVMSTAMTSTTKDAMKESVVVVNGDKDSAIASVLTSFEGIRIIDSEEPLSDLKSGKVQLVINIPEGFDNSVALGKPSKVEILIDDESSKSQAALTIVKSIFYGYKEQIVSSKLGELNLNNDFINPFSLEIKSGVNEDGEINEIGNMMIGMIPSMVVLLLISLTLGLASELGAGEKEKNTFEPLLSTSGNRGSILWGKIASLSIVGGITLIFSMISLVISYNSFISSLSEGEGLGVTLTGGSIMLTIIFSLFLIVTITSLEICISLYARSTKEANTYLSGLLMPVMILAFIPLYSDAKSISEVFFHIPILNSICVIKESMVGLFSTTHIITVLIWQIVYLAIAVFIAKFMFSREEVVFRS